LWLTLIGAFQARIRAVCNIVGGVISPLLANIVLHELDCHIVDNLIPQYTKGKKRANNREYSRTADRRYAAKAKGDWERYSKLGKKLFTMPRCNVQDPKFRRLRYIRYADDVRRS
jgi:retron-type reverse transcriptase